jgi:ribosome-associated protein
MAERGTELIIGPELSIASAEIRFATSRSSGPGGQNVNKVESRVTLLFDLEASVSLDEAQKQRLRQGLATRVTRAGILRVVSQKHRTQAANRRAAEERFVELVRAALARRKPRRATRKPARAERQRLEGKRQRSQLKEYRRRPPRE